MSLLDALFGKPQEYNPETDPMAVPDENEVKNLSLHVRQCARRYASLKQGHVDMAGQLQSTQRLLIIIIGLLVANKIIDLSFLTGLVSP
jgi:hypothetical protein